MGNLAYATQKPEEIAHTVEEMLRKEINSSSPIPYTIEDAGAEKTTVGKVLKDAAELLFIGKEEEALFTMAFDISQPRPATLRVHLNRQGIGCHGGQLLYTTKLSKPVAGEVFLEEPKFLVGSKFGGDPDAAKKLNSNKDLLKRAPKLARTESNVGGLDIEIPLFFRIVPDEQGSMLVINTLPKMVAMGFSASLDAKEFFEVAALVEKTL
jgi:hypothetical protein